MSMSSMMAAKYIHLCLGVGDMMASCICWWLPKIPIKSKPIMPTAPSAIERYTQSAVKTAYFIGKESGRNLVLVAAASNADKSRDNRHCHEEDNALHAQHDHL